AVNEQLEAEVLTRSSHSSRTSYVVAADLSEMELKKILIEKMEGNNLKRRRNANEDKDEEPSAGPDRGSRRRREDLDRRRQASLLLQRSLYRLPLRWKSPHTRSLRQTSYAVAADLSEMELKKILIDKMESNKTLRWIKPGVQEKKRRKRARVNKRSKGKGDQDHWQVYKSHQKTTSESALAEEPMQTTQDLEEPSHQEFETGAPDDQPIIEASQHLEWFQKQKKPPTPDRAWNKTLK
nr:hypothetical protein [Tanacetum cinerariifolium]